MACKWSVNLFTNLNPMYSHTYYMIVYYCFQHILFLLTLRLPQLQVILFFRNFEIL
jgi:hypothetical protein